MNVVKEIERLNQQELDAGIAYEGSWHYAYRDSAWIYVGGLAYELSEGDVLAVFSQVGEIEDINLVRDKDTGKSMGFVFIKYEDHRSTVLAVDNFNGSTLLSRILRVDHVHKYKLPKELRDKEDADDFDDLDDKEMRGQPGHAYKGKELASKYDINKGVDIFKPKLSKEEKKKLKKDKKKAKKRMKEVVDIEAKQMAYFEEVKRKRAARAEEEAAEKRRRMQLEGIENEADFIMPSETGWRGRFEPTISEVYPSKPKDPNAPKPEAQGYGGMNRRR
ncbi:U2 snRNP component IST3 [Achlya hypogyna]|uniref:U2 snRNP component IST3 n=1 Tax=Achlya hypogyna TaxID=1202772 RepID=A0A1V9YDV5_ACHHY|nr:U2 snRNP component IST3 [Achlya hypogyna]